MILANLPQLADGAQALAAARRARPDAALVDIQLPDIDGLALARRLREIDGSLRIVLTSTYPGVGSTDEVRRNGALAFVHKADLPRAPLRSLLGAD